MKTQTYLPIFPGFYGTIFEPSESDEIEYVNQERTEKGLPELNSGDMEFDYDGYELECSKACVSAVETKLQELGLVRKIKFEKLVSPKEYNFANDSINVCIDWKVEETKTYLLDHMDDFRAHLKDRYTSCSGFISSYSAYPSDWLDDLNHCHKLGSALEFILINEGYDSEMLYYDAIDSGLVGLQVKDFEHETTKIVEP